MIRSSLLFFFVTGLFISYGQLPINSTPKQCVESFFELFHEQDTAGLKLLMHEDVVIGTILHNDQDTLLRTDNVEAFYESLLSIPDTISYKEELLKIKIREEGILAQVWTPYQFILNGEKSHEGVNAFTLLNSGGRWKIIYLVDTRRRDNKKGDK